MNLYQKVRKIFVAKVSMYYLEKKTDSCFSLLLFTQVSSAFSLCWIKKSFPSNRKQSKHVYLIGPVGLTLVTNHSELRYSVAFFQKSSVKAVLTKACMWLLPGI